MAEAAVQAGQVQRGVAEASAVALVSIALSLVAGQDEAVEVVQEAVSGEEDVLDSHAVQVVQVMLLTAGGAESCCRIHTVTQVA